MKVSYLASGSAANAAVITSGETSILLDAGLSKKATLSALGTAGVEPGSLGCILITHSHADHCLGAAALAEYLRIPIVSMLGTLEAIPDAGRTGIDRLAIAEDNQFEWGNFRVTRVPVSHDAPSPSGFVLDDGTLRYGHFTDLGEIDFEVWNALAGCEAVYLESNYDVDILQASKYHPAVQGRIRSREGHLSNGDVCEWVHKRMSNRTQQLILGHLSEVANDPRIVTYEVANALGKRNCALSVIRPGGWLEMDLFKAL